MQKRQSAMSLRSARDVHLSESTQCRVASTIRLPAHLDFARPLQLQSIVTALTFMRPEFLKPAILQLSRATS
ncbi:hypothetical protein CKAH01_06636 [Colletotrichum kahawae]|uniref:Uncharacterized protein n=1 Tax=Colletotrichum kahawae TaxID=34407 RepID=A0AAD9Y9E7_COLKA|nr:hypothetical protein CKAH01_06636 [Colletotrichum kahawae]